LKIGNRACCSSVAARPSQKKLCPDARLMSVGTFRRPRDPATLLKPCLPAHLLAEVERVLRHARLMAAALGRESLELEPALPIGLRNAVLRRKGQDF
jgi:hypothetical protein